MATVKIDGISGLNGDYEFDPSYFTNRELHIIKKETGLRAGELGDAVEKGDNDLVITLAYIALLRNGSNLRTMDPLWDAKAGAVTLDLMDETVEDDVEDPPSAPPSGNGVAAVTAAAKRSSGATSKPTSAPQESVPSPTGSGG